MLRAWLRGLWIRLLQACSLYSQSLYLCEYKKNNMAWVFLLTLLSQYPQKFPEQSWLLLFWKWHRDPAIKFSCPIIILAGWQHCLQIAWQFSIVCYSIKSEWNLLIDTPLTQRPQICSLLCQIFKWYWKQQECQSISKRSLKYLTTGSLRLSD